ncbi:hypothetical protein HK101_010051 [Irineochytrium annulatum]|nr:hypothetical protein HK101_010051 [Irineochytrium annulatum]
MEEIVAEAAAALPLQDEEEEGPAQELTLDDSEAVTSHMQEVEEELLKADEEEEQERLEKLVSYRVLISVHLTHVSLQSKEEFNEAIAQQRRSRLTFLINQAGVYSNWLASRLELRQREQLEGGRTLLGDAKASALEDGQEEEEDAPASKGRTTRGGGKKRKAAGGGGGNAKKGRKGKKTNALVDLAVSNVPATAAPEEAAKSADPPTAPNESEAPAVGPSHVPEHRQPSMITGCVMRDYQLVGMEWLISLWEQGLNGILADEMGLGKTLQTIAFLAHLTEMQVWGPFLIVAPLSTLSNWISEIHRFAPKLNAVLYHGLTTERAAIRRERLSVLNKNFPIVVTSYEIVMNDRRYLQKFKWKYIIIDEGHRLKNLNCRLMKELKAYPSANRLILSGTPLQNNLAELWSLLNFLMPDIFESLEDFEGWFDFEDLKDEQNEKKILDKESKDSVISNLHQILRPFLLRRVKTEVAVELPKKREMLLFAPLVPKQKELYDACVRGVNGLRQHLIKKMDAEKGLANGGGAAGEGGSNGSDMAIADGLEPVDDGDLQEGDREAENEEEEDEDHPKKRRRSSRVFTKVGSYKERISDDKYFDMIEKKAEKDAATAMLPAKKDEMTSARIVSNQNLQNVVMQLRKICNHPYLFDVPSEEADRELDDFAKGKDGKTAGRWARKSLKGTDSTSDEVAVRLPDIVSSSGKMLMLERLLPRLLERGHKVLIFSQMTRMLDILADWLEFVKKLKFCRIDGNVPIAERREQIHSFNTATDCNVFLLSTRAGGLGINLTAADTVIIFDSDWNPQVDLQAQDRVHRIGQTKPVIIYRLVTSGTVEKKILDKANSKRKLEKLVIHKSEFKGKSDYYKNNSARVSNLAELAAILDADEAESVTLSAVNPSSDERNMILMNRVISDEELEKIMDRSPESFDRKRRVVAATVEGEGAGKGVTGIGHDRKGKAERFLEVEEEEAIPGIHRASGMKSILMERTVSVSKVLGSGGSGYGAVSASTPFWGGTSSTTSRNTTSLLGSPASASSSSPSLSYSTVTPSFAGKNLSLGSLPPDLIIRIFVFLPVPDLPKVARCSRRLKILAYNDDVYEHKLVVMGMLRNPEPDRADVEVVREEMKIKAELAAVSKLSSRLKQMPGGNMLPGGINYLETPNTGREPPITASVSDGQLDLLAMGSSRSSSSSSSSPQRITATVPNLKRSALTIGSGGLQGAGRAPTNLPLTNTTLKAPIDHHRSQVIKALNGVRPRDAFKAMYSHLCPYYLDFRKKQKDSKVFKDHQDLIEIADVLRQLRAFSLARFITACEEINFQLETTMEWFESMVLAQFERAYDLKKVDEMRRNALACYKLNGGAACVQLFISKNPIFFDQTFNPSLLPRLAAGGGGKGGKGTAAQLAPVSATGYALAEEFAKFMDHMLNSSKEQATLVGLVFEQEMDAMTAFVSKVFEDSIAEYLSAVLVTARDRETSGVYLHTLATAVHCCTQFLDYIAVAEPNVTVGTAKIKESIIALFKSYTDGYMELELNHLGRKFDIELKKWNKRKDVKPKLGEKGESYLGDAVKAQAHKRQVMNAMKTVLFAPMALGKTLAIMGSGLVGIGTGSTTKKDDGLKDEEEIDDAITYYLDDDSIGSLVSLELSLKLMHANKEALGRILVITSAVDPKRLRNNVGQVFCKLLHAIGERHMRPAFETAISRLSRSVPIDNWSPDNEKSVNMDSLQFFELVHISDLIHQMVDVYYAEDVKPWIDENDFLSDIMVDKKSFDRSSDDNVASGMDKSIQVLINQCDHIMDQMHSPTDYNPPDNQTVFDLRPTKACATVVECLCAHVKLLTGSTNKDTLEVFLGEVAIRLFNVICKNIKRWQISPAGATQLICDLNRFHEWGSTLRVQAVSKLFLVLKELGNLYLAEGGTELRNMVHDAERYQGALRPEEIYELLAARTDYKNIQKFVETKEEAFIWTLLLSLCMFFGSFTAGNIPLALHFSEDKLRLLSTFGSGLLVGTALIVIVPEGVETLYAVQEASVIRSDTGDSHGKNEAGVPALDNVGAEPEGVRDGGREFMSPEGAGDHVHDHVHDHGAADVVPERSPVFPLGSEGDPPVPVPGRGRRLKSRSGEEAGYAMYKPQGPARRAALKAPAVNAGSSGHVYHRVEEPPAAEEEEGEDGHAHHEHAVEANGYIGPSLMLGFLFMLLIDQIGSAHAHEHSHVSVADLKDGVAPPPNRGEKKKMAATIGLVVHAAADGIALGAASASSE